MTIAIRAVDLNVLNLHTRMPFQYGIAEMTALPHLFVSVTAEVDGRSRVGVAADHLPPKWFTKNPATSFRDDVAEMVTVIRAACESALSLPEAETVFALWRQLYERQQAWAGNAYPPLLWGFGVSLVERAAIDAFCRATNRPFAEAVRANTLGIRLGAIHRELEGAAPSDFLPDAPLGQILLRHTVGLSDPLTEEEIPEEARLDDGLPQSLEASIHAYGLTHFKIKVSGDSARDIARLRSIAAVVEQACTGYAFTLDGNEQVRSVEQFRAFWETLRRDPTLSAFLGHLLFVEQPLHREVALDEEVGRALLDWPKRPPIIIDESDATLDSLPTALERGYAGTSHKNCKGVFKGIANACLIAHRARQNPGQPLVLSAEDLTNVGPVALLQDLAVVATLGISHAERNGQHYFRGTSMLPDDLQQRLLARHGDLYRRHERGFAMLDVQGGAIKVGSLVQAPFGVAFDPEPSRFTPLAAWEFDSLAGLADSAH